MSHPVGERLHCDACGAEIQFTKACTCPSSEAKRHSDVCCGQEMRPVATERQGDSPSEVRKTA